MPIVCVQMYPGRTQAQKTELARAITEAMVNIAKTTPDAVHVIFQEVSRDDWAVAGVLASAGAAGVSAPPARPRTTRRRSPA